MMHLDGRSKHCGAKFGVTGSADRTEEGVDGGAPHCLLLNY